MQGSSKTVVNMYSPAYAVHNLRPSKAPEHMHGLPGKKGKSALQSNTYKDAPQCRVTLIDCAPPAGR